MLRIDSWLPDLILLDTESLLGHVQEATIKVKFDHLVTGAELWILCGEEAKWEFSATDVYHETHVIFVGYLFVELINKEVYGFRDVDAKNSVQNRENLVVINQVAPKLVARSNLEVAQMEPSVQSKCVANIVN